MRVVAPQIDFAFPVADTLVGAFGHVSEGDVLYKRGLFADALKCYTQCVNTAGAFEGGWSARVPPRTRASVQIAVTVSGPGLFVSVAAPSASRVFSQVCFCSVGEISPSSDSFGFFR